MRVKKTLARIGFVLDIRGAHLLHENIRNERNKRTGGKSDIDESSLLERREGGFLSRGSTCGSWM